MKYCNTCKLSKDINDFPKNHLKRDGLGGKCKTCQNEAARASYAKNREYRCQQRREKKKDPTIRLRLNWKAREAYITHQKFKKKSKEYGISVEEVKRLLSGACEICGAIPDPNHAGKAQRTLNIDHDHKLNHVRGVLCSSCNSGLGRFKDCPSLLRKAAEYLEQNKRKDNG